MKIILFLFLSFNLSAQDNWKFTNDKQLHFAGCATVSLFVSSIHGSDGHEFHNLKGGLVVGFLTGASLGLSKELVYDYALKGGSPSLPDFGYSVLGSVTGCLITYVFYKLTDGRKKSKL